MAWSDPPVAVGGRGGHGCAVDRRAGGCCHSHQPINAPFVCRLEFDDLHRTGIYTWPFLHQLGTHKLSRCSPAHAVRALAARRGGCKPGAKGRNQSATNCCGCTPACVAGAAVKSSAPTPSLAPLRLPKQTPSRMKRYIGELRSRGLSRDPPALRRRAAQRQQQRAETAGSGGSAGSGGGGGGGGAAPAGSGGGGSGGSRPG